MRSWNTSTEDGLRRLLNEWDPIGVADDAHDEYDCMLAPLRRRLRSGAGVTEISAFLRHELEDHFGLDPLGLRPAEMAVRLVDWWKSAAQSGDVARAHVQLPAEAVAATVLIEVVRISALPAKRGAPYPGRVGAHWAGSEATDALTLIENLPGSGQHRCGFAPGWSVRAYEDSLELALFEAVFCFGCHEVRMHGAAVPPALATQFFDADSPSAQALLALFRAATP
ncbi:hypothetical protein [Streptomyces sp. NPDC059957]|uniref:hypothetical protein n=1 Tax=unclassified Streptomyces TaxID=2593676 RepID=UPI00366400BF